MAILGAAGFGAAWAFLPGWLQAKRGSHIVITTIMFNFIASALMTYLLVNVLIKPGQQSPETREFAAGTWMPFAHELLARVGINFTSTPLNFAFVLARAKCVGAGVAVRLAHALGLCVAGGWPESGGGDLRRYFTVATLPLIAMLISGALAGWPWFERVDGVATSHPD